MVVGVGERRQPTRPNGRLTSARTRVGGSRTTPKTSRPSSAPRARQRSRLLASWCAPHGKRRTTKLRPAHAKDTLLPTDRWLRSARGLGLRVAGGERTGGVACVPGVLQRDGEGSVAATERVGRWSSRLGADALEGGGGGAQLFEGGFEAAEQRRHGSGRIRVGRAPGEPGGGLDGVAAAVVGLVLDVASWRCGGGGRGWASHRFTERRRSLTRFEC